MLSSLLDSVRDLVEAERVMVLLLDEDGRRKYIRGRTSQRTDLPARDIRVSLSVMSLVQSTGEPLFVADVRSIQGLQEADSLEELGTRSVMCVPLRCQEERTAGTSRRHEIFGFIYADGTEVHEGFTQEQRSAFEVAASFAAAIFQLQRWYLQGACDQETGLAASGHFLVRLAGACREARLVEEPLTLVALAVRNYPDLCRSHGSAAGRRVLQEVATRLQTVREIGCQVARGGPFHFYLYFPGQTPLMVLRWLEGFRRTLEAPVTNDRLPISCGLGLAAFPEPAGNSRQLVLKAEQALTAALADPEGVKTWTEELAELEPAQRLTALLSGNTSRDYRNISAVLETLKALHEAPGLPAALEQFLLRVQELAGADEGYLFVGKDRQSWTLRACRPWRKKDEEFTGRVEILKNLAATLPAGPGPHLQEAALEGRLSLFWLSLVVREEPVGMLVLAGPTTRMGVETSDRPFFDALAREASLFLFWALQSEQEGERLRRENEALRSTLPGGGDEMVAESPTMRTICGQAARVADSDLAILILGKSGTGKEHFARHLHALSSRRTKPFVVIDCTTIPAGLFESELFGHETGAFTGASERRIGRVEAAAGGTLFLDEVGELPAGMQAKFLRMLQEKIVTRVGGTHPVSVDIRVMAATNRDLEEEVKAGRFREDLFFRLKGYIISLPPLRERKKDILPLARYFLRRATLRHQRELLELAPETARVLLSYPWKGNIRELVTRMEVAATLATGNLVYPADLDLAAEEITSGTAEFNYQKAQREWLESYIRQLLLASRHNVSRAAELAGISRTAFTGMMKRTGVKKER